MQVSEAMQRILVVDDHPIVRRGIREALTEALSGVHVEEAGTAEAALEALQRTTWDAVVLDLSLPGRDGMGLLADIKHRYPSVPVLVLSVHREDQYAVRALRNGASGYLSKSAAPEEIVDAVTRVASGRRYVSDAVAEQLSTVVARRGGGEGHETLSDRELDVLRGIGVGKTVGQLAEQMHLSVKTISTYRSRLLEKLDLHTNAQLVRYALDHHLVV